MLASYYLFFFWISVADAAPLMGLERVLQRFYSYLVTVALLNNNGRIQETSHFIVVCICFPRFSHGLICLWQCVYSAAQLKQTMLPSVLSVKNRSLFYNAHKRATAPPAVKMNKMTERMKVMNRGERQSVYFNHLITWPSDSYRNMFNLGDFLWIKRRKC